MARIFPSMAGLILLLVSFSGSGLCAPEESPPLRRVTFIPQWVPQAQFAGFYVARDRGIFKKYGLDVEILRGGPESPPSELLERGQADFGTLFLSTGIERFVNSEKLVNIAQLVQRSTLMLVARKSSGIISPADMNGRKVSLWSKEFQLQPLDFFERYKLTVQVVPQGTSVNLFLRGAVDVASAMWYNEYHVILNAGIDPDELTTFFFFDHGMNFPEDGIYCRLEMFEQDPDLCCRFVRASIEGWSYAFDHPEEAIDIVMKVVNEANRPTDRVHQKWMLERMRDAIIPEGERGSMGWLSLEDYLRVAGELQQNGWIQSYPDYSQFFHDCAHHD